MHPWMIGLAMATGAAATFNPCGVGLLPAFVGLTAGATLPSRVRTLEQGLVVGMAMTGGLLALYVVIAISFGMLAGWLGTQLPRVGLAMGMALVLWGIGLWWFPQALGWRWSAPGAIRGRGAFLYGVAFGLGSLGCTFPLFLSLLIQAGASGSPAGGAVVVTAYAVGMGLVLTALATGARLARVGVEHWLAWMVPRLPRVVSAMVTFSGLLVTAYWGSGGRL